MKLSNKKGIQNMVLTLAELGLKEVVLCPGSRNAPFIISFNRYPAFHCFSIRDERSAAFFALGKAVELEVPVAIVCTSGSASLNFAPAISEAYYQRIPLIVITADRPKEWTDQGDGQTINQTNLYQNVIRRSYDLKGEAASAHELWYNTRCLSEGYNVATVSDRGPVHFNVPLNEPLYQLSDIAIPKPRVFKERKIKKTFSKNDLADLAEKFSNSSKVMILAGQLPINPFLQEELSRMAKLENVAVLTESTSNLHHPDFVENIDRCITHWSEVEKRTLTPDLLITVGGAVVSKRIKAVLRKYKPQHHWNVDPYNAEMDTYQSLTRAFFIEPALFLQQLYPEITPLPSRYRKNWMRLKKNVENLHKIFCKNCDFSDFWVFSVIYSYIPDHIHLHLSNSSPIRYAQLFDNQRIASTWSNRGTSGIDGCTSTAMGAASAAPEKSFLLISGDVAFQYDINGLWNDQPIENLNIIIINNGGGGIFRIIAGPDSVEERDPYFVTAMKSNAEKIAAHFKWNYYSAREENSLKNTLKTFFDRRTQRTILEIFTIPEKNPVVLKQYWQFLNENIKNGK